MWHFPSSLSINLASNFSAIGHGGKKVYHIYKERMFNIEYEVRRSLLKELSIKDQFTNTRSTTQPVSRIMSSVALEVLFTEAKSQKITLIMS